MSVDDRMWRFVQKHLGYSNDELERFKENPRNEDVMSKAALLMDKVIVIAVVATGFSLVAFKRVKG